MPKPINTFVIPCLNNVEGLIKSVESYYKYTPADSFRVIVVFNGTMTDYLTALAALGDKVHIWLKPYKNLGFGKSMNEGIRLADTEFVTLANDDCEVIYPEWWDETMELFKADPTLGGFNPHSFINKRSSGERAIQYDQKDEYDAEDIKKMKEIFHNERWYTGVCTFFTICRKDLFDKIGYYDESFGLGSGEDYDLCIRATKAGYFICGGSKVMVKHWWGATKDNLPKDPSFTSNFDMIMKGNQHMERKWGPHCQEVGRRLESGKMTQEEADALKGGWTVGGRGGIDEPLDKDTVLYPDKKWFQIVDL